MYNVNVDPWVHFIGKAPSSYYAGTAKTLSVFQVKKESSGSLSKREVEETMSRSRLTLESSLTLSQYFGGPFQYAS